MELYIQHMLAAAAVRAYMQGATYDMSGGGGGKKSLSGGERGEPGS